MRKEECPFKVGDVVQMKTWEEAVDEFGAHKGYGGEHVIFPDDLSILKGFEGWGKIGVVKGLPSYLDADNNEHVVLYLECETFTYEILWMSPYAVKPYDYNSTNIFGMVNECVKVLQDEIKSITGE